MIFDGWADEATSRYDDRFIQIEAFCHCHFLRNKVGDPPILLYDLTLGEKWRKSHCRKSLARTSLTANLQPTGFSTVCFRYENSPLLNVAIWLDEFQLCKISVYDNCFTVRHLKVAFKHLMSHLKICRIWWLCRARRPEGNVVHSGPR